DTPSVATCTDQNRRQHPTPGCFIAPDRWQSHPPEPAYGQKTPSPTARTPLTRTALSEMPLFSSDYPHVVGGRNMIGRFERSLGDRSGAVRQRFYCDNFVDLIGSALG